MNRKIQVRFLEGKGGVIRPTYSIQSQLNINCEGLNFKSSLIQATNHLIAVREHKK
jgi:hypothetical protein